MTANFSQTGRGGQTLNGVLTMKRPGKVRFQYAKGVPLLIVGDGKALTMIDYQVKQVSRWPIGNSPLSVLLNPNQDLARIATVTRNDAQVLLVSARDPKRPEFGTITISFAKVPSAPAGLMPSGLDDGGCAERPVHGAAFEPALQRRGGGHGVSLCRSAQERPEGLNSLTSFIRGTG
jgi:hypothetical protein